MLHARFFKFLYPGDRTKAYKFDTDPAEIATILFKLVTPIVCDGRSTFIIELYLTADKEGIVTYVDVEKDISIPDAISLIPEDKLYEACLREHPVALFIRSKMENNNAKDKKSKDQ